jgi:alpha-glucosidase
VTTLDRPEGATWWRGAVVYQVYLRSFADGNGDGLGDLAGLRARLPYLVALGVDAVWINPWYPSPMVDAGYDVSDYRSVDPRFGTLAEAEALLAEAHAAGLRVLLDIVPNHTSDQHPWFRAALAAGPGSPERERYLFRPGRGPGGNEPPNDWTSVGGGLACTRVTEPGGTPGEWYLHLFTAEQPDVDWTHPEVRADFAKTLGFWFDRGVDGFRIDVAHSLAKQEGLPDVGHGATPGHPAWDRDEVHDIYREWRAVADAYPEPRIGAPPTWVLSNHDTARHLSRYAREPTGERGVNLRHLLGRPADLARGTRRARAAALLMLALPGGAYLYQGEELGLPEVEDLPIEVLDDPVWERSGRTDRGRDGCRVPIPWAPGGPPYGFSPAGAALPPWLPQPPAWEALAVAVQDGAPASMLELYRAALRLRRAHPALGDGTLRWLEMPDGVLAFARDPGFACVVNVSGAPSPLPAGTDVLLASGPLAADGTVPPDTTVWLGGRAG